MDFFTKYFNLFEKKVPLTYYCVGRASKKNKNKEVKKSIQSKDYNSNLVLISPFHKPISKMI